MRSQKPYGGAWTEDKLKRLKAYLRSYMTILRKHGYYETIYVDAFAGSGTIEPTGRSNEPPAEAGDSEQDFIKGSAQMALEADPPFDRYVFVERSPAKCEELTDLRAKFPDRAGRIIIENADATVYVRQWCAETDWSRTRAVLFLDPFGMQVGWSLLETIAATEAIDLWLLVPLGIGANRLLTKDELPPAEWQAKLTQFFGTDEWEKRFYGPKMQPGLFDRGDEVEKRVDHDALKAYFIERLNVIFPGGVANNPLVQRNSRGSPLFLLCFATANRKRSVQSAALRIAGYLLRE